MGHRERMVGRDRVAVVVKRLEQRELDDPEELQPALVDRRTAELHPHRAEHVVDQPPRTGGDEQEVTGLRTQGVDGPELLSLERNLSTGQSRPPPSVTRIHTRPAAPSCLARSTSLSTWARDIPPSPGSRIALTRSAWKARNSVAAYTSLRSTSSRPKRVSGLSEP